MFSDVYEMWNITDELCLEVEAKMVSRTEGNIDDLLIGGSAYAKGPEGEDNESTVIIGPSLAGSQIHERGL